MGLYGKINMHKMFICVVKNFKSLQTKALNGLLYVDNMLHTFTINKNMSVSNLSSCQLA